MGDKNKRAKRSKEKAKNHRKASHNSKAGSANNEFDELMTKMIDEQHEPRQYFGYAQERQQDEDPFELPDTGMICMVSEVKNEPLVIETGVVFKVGEWFVSEIIKEHEHIVHGPFDSEVDALEFGSNSLKVKSYRSAPEFCT